MKRRTLKEHSRVVLTTDLPAAHLTAGDVGCIVHVYRDRAAYEVEFLTLTGETAAVLTVEAGQLRPVGRDDISHARVAQRA